MAWGAAFGRATGQLASSILYSVQPEANMKFICAALFALALAALAPPSSAAEVNLQKTSADDLKALCQKVGGAYSEDNSGYGCSTDCQGGKGTDCTVYCPSTAKRCTAQVDGARRPKTVEQALAPVSKRKR